MKKSIIVLSLLMSAASLHANMTKGVAVNVDDMVSPIEGVDASQIVRSVEDPEYDWSQTDSKKIKVELKNEALVLESKEDDGVAFTIAELPINLEDNNDFLFGVTLVGPKLDDKKSLGLIFDYEDGRNYKGLAIFKKQYEYFVVKDGTLSSVKTGLVKMKGNSYTITMQRISGKVEFKLNDLEICTLKKVSITNGYFGAFIRGKMKATMPYFLMYNGEVGESEQSTTD